MNDNSNDYDVKFGDDDDDAVASNDDDDDDDTDTAVRWKQQRRRRRPRRPSLSSPFASATTSPSSYSSSTPILSPSSSYVPFFFLPRYLQTLATAILAFTGLICILISAQSCQFLTVSHTIHFIHYDHDNDATIHDDIKFKNSNNSNVQSTSSFSSSIGIFCNSNDDDDFNIDDDFILETMHDLSSDNDGNDIMLALSRAFTCISILCSMVLSILTIGISTTFISPSMTSKIWNGRDGAGGASSIRRQICNISFLSAITFVFHLPILFLMESRHCKNTGGSVSNGNDDDASSSISMMMEITNKCTLSHGSIPLLLSMGMYVALALFAHWKDCPDWQEDYELWKLMKQQRINRGNCEEKAIHDGIIDEEQGRIEATTTTVDVEERQVQHSATAIAETVVAEQPPSRQSCLNQAQRRPTQKDVGANPVEGKLMKTQLLLQHTSNGTRTNVKTFSPPTSPSTPPSPPPVSPPQIQSNDSILLDLDMSLLTSSIASVSSREGKKRELSKLLREEREKAERKYLDAEPKQHQFPSTVVVAPLDSGYTSGVGSEEKQPTNDAILDNQHDMTKKASTRPPFVSIRNHRNEGGEKENNNATTISASTSAPNGDADVKSKPFFIADELEWPFSAENDFHADDAMMVPHSINKEPSSPSSIRIKIMNTSSPLTKFSSKMALMVNNDFHDANHIIHIVRDDNDEEDGDGFEGGGTESYVDNQNCKAGADGDSSLISIKNNTNGGSILVADSSTGASATSLARMVSPEKGDHDPELDIYPSDGSLSTLSLATDDYRSTDDEDNINVEGHCSVTRKKRQDQIEQEQQQYQQQPQMQLDQHQRQDQPQDQQQRKQRIQQQQKQVMPRNGNCNFLSDDYSSEDSELSAVIAGVQRLNRKTSGKITPLNKRRRRKRGSSGMGTGQSSACSGSASSFSSHGSLLDEVIVEEGELNSSYEGAGAVASGAGCGGEGSHGNESSKRGVPILPSESGFDKASSLPSSASPTNTATSKKKKKIRRHRKIHGNDISIEDSIGSDHSINSDGSSNTEDSIISAAARERRNRIATQRQSQIDPEGEYDSSSMFSRPVSPNDFPDLLLNYRSYGGKVDNHRGINNRPPPISSVNSNISVDQKAWQARKVRMMRLRMIRGHDDDVVHVVRRADGGGSSSDGDADDDFVVTTNIVRMEKSSVDDISRARQGVVLACSSDEDSI